MDNIKEEILDIAKINLKFFYVRTEKPEKFIDKLEQLCREYSPQEDFFFKYSIED